jgi:endonuclease-3
VVLGHALGVPGLPVDRHVLRVANRIGIAEGDDPVAVETQLGAAMPRERWTKTSDILILHGRRICKPQPLCEQCAVTPQCDYFQAARRDTPAAARVRTAAAPVKVAGAKAARTKVAAAKASAVKASALKPLTSIRKNALPKAKPAPEPKARTAPRKRR